MPEEDVNKLAQNGFNERARRYWNTQAVAAPEMLGVAPMGECGFFEVLYRHREEVRHLTRLVAFNKQTSVLELGSGNGRWIESIAPRVKYYEAVDFSDQMIATASARIRSLRLDNVQLFQAKIQDHVPTRTFDVIYFGGVSQYLQDGELLQLVSRLRNYLSVTGVLVERSTLHRYDRKIKMDGYACIYRTADELAEIFGNAEYTKSYHRESYTPLSFPPYIQRLLLRPKIERLLIAAIPLSFVILRVCASISKGSFGYFGEMKTYSHDFMLFHPGSS